MIGHSIQQQAATVLEDLGGDPTDFAARQLTPRIAAGADLILTMTKAHRDAVLELAPNRLQRTFTLAEASQLASELHARTVADLAALRPHLSTRDLPQKWSLRSEAYNYDVDPSSNGARVLVNLDDTTVTGGKMGRLHPYSWYHDFDGGRVWYTVGGANIPDYDNPEVLLHLLGGIRYAGAC